MNQTEEIKSRLPVEQVIGDYLTLKKSGSNYKALCPFHREDTPSFNVSAEKQIWHCFGCSEGGDIFSFVQKFEGISFREALEMLAGKAGVTVHPVQRIGPDNKKTLLEINERAAKFFEAKLHTEAAEAKKVREYLAVRGLKPETVLAWRLGLAPDSWDELTEVLRGSFKTDDLVAAGVLMVRDNRLFDRFRRRLMFPITNSHGSVIAFTARTLSKIVYDEEEPGGKYVNSPATPVYNKSETLYGFSVARLDIKRAGYVIVVEGNMDVIMAYQAGTRNVVAASGTAFTVQQLTLLRRQTDNVMIAFDADAAGSQAVYRGISAAWELGMNVKVIVLTGGKDPAEVIARDPRLWQQAIRESVGIVDYYFDEVFARVDLSRADHKKMAIEKIAGIIAGLKTVVETAHYTALLAKKIGLPEHAIAASVEQARKPQPVHSPASTRGKKQHSLVDHIFAFIAQHPVYLQQLADEVEPDLMDAPAADLYKKIIIHYTKQHEINFRELHSELSELEMQRWSELVFFGELVYGQFSRDQCEREFNSLTQRLRLEFISQQLREVTGAIRVAEQSGRNDDVTSLLRRYDELLQKRRNVSA